MNNTKLTDDQIAAMADEVRRSGVVRPGQFWDLLGHITATHDATCESCGLWVRYDSPDGARGECCLPMTPNSPVQLMLIGPDPAALLAAFDHGCKRWIPRPEPSSEAQQPPSGEKGEG